MPRWDSRGPVVAPHKKQGPRKAGPQEFYFLVAVSYGVGFLAGAGVAGFGEAGAEAAGAPPPLTGYA